MYFIKEREKKIIQIFFSYSLTIPYDAIPPYHNLYKFLCQTLIHNGSAFGKHFYMQTLVVFVVVVLELTLYSIMSVCTELKPFCCFVELCHSKIAITVISPHPFAPHLSFTLLLRLAKMATRKMLLLGFMTF